MRIESITSSVTTFRSITFNKDFSVILGVAKQKGEGKDHNLGKTLLIKILDNILFGSRDSERIKKLKKRFNNPAFTLEIETAEGQRTIIADYSKKRVIAFPKDVRDDYEYYIRYQDEFRTEFRKGITRVKDRDWKPLLLELMGFDKQKLVDKYEIEETISGYEKFIEVANDAGLKKEANRTRIEELIKLKSAFTDSLSSLNLTQSTIATVVDIADNIDEKITDLKKDRFFKQREFASIESALNEDLFIQFPLSRIEDMYTSLRLYFGDQLKSDISEVEKFARQITSNRKTGLTSLKAKLALQIQNIDSELSKLYTMRTDRLKAITTHDAIEEYKALSNQLAEVQSELAILQQDVYKESIINANKEVSILKTQQLKLAAKVAQEIDDNFETFNEIKSEYSKIMREVMDIDAELQIIKNSTGNVEFKAISWLNGVQSEELDGEMARKISCAAFDIAIRISHSDELGFLIHDGVIDNAGRNVKEKFIQAVKKRVKQYHFQYILTAIKDADADLFSIDDICITLSDKSERDLLMGANY